MGVSREGISNLSHLHAYLTALHRVPTCLKLNHVLGLSSINYSNPIPHGMLKAAHHHHHVSVYMTDCPCLEARDNPVGK